MTDLLTLMNAPKPERPRDVSEEMMDCYQFGRVESTSATATYPASPGYVARDTSRQAAQSIARHVTRLASEVLEYIQAKPRTCWEIEVVSGMSHQTVSARVRELNLKGRIRDSGERRPTGSGRAAIVWAVVA